MRNLIFLLFALSITLTGCRMMEETKSTPEEDMYKPMDLEVWTIAPNTKKNICVIDSNNGIKVALLKKDRKIKHSVISTHYMKPYTRLHLRIGKNVFRTASNEFSQKDSEEIVNKLKHSTLPAYLEWTSRNQDRFSIKRRVSTNIIKPKNFNKVYDQCLSRL